MCSPVRGEKRPEPPPPAAGASSCVGASSAHERNTDESSAVPSPIAVKSAVVDPSLTGAIALCALGVGKGAAVVDAMGRGRSGEVTCVAPNLPSPFALPVEARK